MLLQTAGIQCNPDAQNNCQWAVPLVLDPQTAYNWKIVAKNTAGYSTTSQVFRFITGY